MNKICLTTLLLVFTGCVGLIPSTSENNANIASKKITFLRNDLQSLRQNGENSKLDHLLDRANRIAQMNDKCATISLNDVLDEDCQTFYSIELPQFEKDVATATGEIRIGALQLGNELQNKIQKISACANALQAFVLPYSSLADINGDIVDLEPLDAEGKKFKVSYNFSLKSNKETAARLGEMKAQWQTQCNEFVIEKTTGKYTNLFISEVRKLNQQLDQAGIKAFIEPIVQNTTYRAGAWIEFNLKGEKFGVYYLNGRKLFEATSNKYKLNYMEIATTVSYNYFHSYDMEKIYHYPETLIGIEKNFQGNEVFRAENYKDLKGKWIWY